MKHTSQAAMTTQPSSGDTALMDEQRRLPADDIFRAVGGPRRTEAPRNVAKVIGLIGMQDTPNLAQTPRLIPIFAGHNIERPKQKEA
ncbi:MAG: hypothetical protein AB1340_10860 [Pseudomonadota bacterium]